ncbi:MAG TPA: GIY-YIG nuclease family protein, partial [Bacteroidales bacterium]|nr:GIY-YIG nuclease family protein [Bacteroidales bacterium]
VFSSRQSCFKAAFLFMYYVYILKSLKDGRFYIGSTADVEKRLLYHNSGRQRSTKNRIPFVLVYSESFEDKAIALAREKQIKSFKGGRAFKILMDNFKNISD